LGKRLLEGKASDYEKQLRIQEAKKHWHGLIKRSISITQFLESHSLAFRGHRKSISLDLDTNSGNFNDLVNLLSKYDPVLREHFRLIHENEIRDHY
jgi:hypothetical protein